MALLSKSVAVVVSLIAVGVAHADLFAIRQGSRSALYSMDETTGESHRVGFTDIPNACGLDSAPDGTLYSFSLDDKMLYRIDPMTAIATAVGPLGWEFDLEGGLAVTSESTAYAVVSYVGDDIVPRESSILRVDLATGASTEVWRFPRGDLSGITVRSDGRLVVYGAVATYSLYFADLEDERVESFGPQFVGGGPIAGLTSDGETAFLLINGVLVRVDLYTGVTSVVNADVRPNITGLAMARPVCIGDCDNTGQIDLDDIDCFVSGFLASDLERADCDGSGILNYDDIDCFVSGFLNGCP